MEDIGIQILWTLGPFTDFCYILWTFGIVRGNLGYFFLLWYFVPRKIWQPWLDSQQRFRFVESGLLYFWTSGSHSTATKLHKKNCGDENLHTAQYISTLPK
jgi:hypothetical protein